jgi:hypothetical protein
MLSKSADRSVEDQVHCTRPTLSGDSSRQMGRASVSDGQYDIPLRFRDAATFTFQFSEILQSHVVYNDKELIDKPMTCHVMRLIEMQARTAVKATLVMMVEDMPGRATRRGRTKTGHPSQTRLETLFNPYSPFVRPMHTPRLPGHWDVLVFSIFKHI